MSEGPELDGLEALAAEHALGVLSGPERARAEALMLKNPHFAQMAADWRERLAPLLGEVEAVAPPEALWRAIERRLPANDNLSLRRRLRFWRGAAVGALGLAVASLAGVMLLVGRPPSPIQTPPAGRAAPILHASLMSGPQPLFVVSYDPMSKSLVVTSLARPGSDPAHVHELWLIPPGGKPHRLGMIAPGKSKAMPMAGSKMAPMLAPGTAIAVSVEPPGGSPMDHPSGPIAAMGRLSKI